MRQGPGRKRWRVQSVAPATAECVVRCIRRIDTGKHSGVGPVEPRAETLEVLRQRDPSQDNVLAAFTDPQPRNPSVPFPRTRTLFSSLGQATLVALLEHGARAGIARARDAIDLLLRCVSLSSRVLVAAKYLADFTSPRCSSRIRRTNEDPLIDKGVRSLFPSPKFLRNSRVNDERSWQSCQYFCTYHVRFARELIRGMRLVFWRWKTRKFRGWCAAVLDQVVTAPT